MATNDKPNYYQLAKAQITKTKAFIISECSKGGFTLAQKMSILDEETGKPTTIYLKGAVHIANVEALEKIRDMFTVAINSYREEHDSVDWDEIEKKEKESK